MPRVELREITYMVTACDVDVRLSEMRALGPFLGRRAGLGWNRRQGQVCSALWLCGCVWACVAIRPSRAEPGLDDRSFATDGASNASPSYTRNPSTPHTLYNMSVGGASPARPSRGWDGWKRKGAQPRQVRAVSCAGCQKKNNYSFTAGQVLYSHFTQGPRLGGSRDRELSFFPADIQ